MRRGVNERERKEEERKSIKDSKREREGGDRKGRNKVKGKQKSDRQYKRKEMC